MHVGLYIKGKTFCNKANSEYDVWSKYIQQSPLQVFVGAFERKEKKPWKTISQSVG